MEVVSDQSSNRSIADALALLAKRGSLDGDRAEIRALPMELPDGGIVAPVAVVGDVKGKQFGVSLVNAKAFKARDTYGELHQYDVSELSGTIVDGHGNAQLADGTYIHSIDLIPGKFPKDLTVEEEEILLDVIHVLELGERCTREICPEFLPRMRVLDFQLIFDVGSEIKLQSLKKIAYLLEKCAGTQGYPLVSRQRLAGILSRAGLRSSPSGRRASRRAV